MSQISAAGMSGVTGGAPLRPPSTSPTPTETPVTTATPTETPATPVAPADGSGSQSPAAGTSLDVGRSETSSATTERLSLSSSSMSLSVEQSAANDKLAMLVMLLIQMLFGKDDEDEDKKDPFVGLAAMMLLSTLGGSSERMSYIESNTSQVAYSSTTTSVSAVQASAYGQGAAASLDGTTGLGGNLDIQG